MEDPTHDEDLVEPIDSITATELDEIGQAYCDEHPDIELTDTPPFDPDGPHGENPELIDEGDER